MSALACFWASIFFHRSFASMQQSQAVFSSTSFEICNSISLSILVLKKRFLRERERDTNRFYTKSFSNLDKIKSIESKKATLLSCISLSRSTSLDFILLVRLDATSSPKGVFGTEPRLCLAKSSWIVESRSFFNDMCTWSRKVKQFQMLAPEVLRRHLLHLKAMHTHSFLWEKAGTELLKFWEKMTDLGFCLKLANLPYIFINCLLKKGTFCLHVIHLPLQLTYLRLQNSNSFFKLGFPFPQLFISVYKMEIGQLEGNPQPKRKINRLKTIVRKIKM